MLINSEKLVKYICAELETVKNKIQENYRKNLSNITYDEFTRIVISTDQLQGYKIALEKILDALPDFEQKD